MGNDFVQNSFGAFQQMIRNATVRDRPYLFQYYKVEHKLPPVYDNTNKLSRMRNTLGQVINQADRYPKLIVLIFDVSILTEITTEAIAQDTWFWLFQEMRKCTEAWKDTLHQKAVNPLWPKFIVSKLIPKQASRDIGAVFKKCRRLFNRALDKVVNKMHNFVNINPDNIIPSDDAMFSVSSVLFI